MGCAWMLLTCEMLFWVKRVCTLRTAAEMSVHDEMRLQKAVDHKCNVFCIPFSCGVVTVQHEK